MADTNSETPNANLDPSIENPAAAPAGNDESTANNITAQPVVQPEHADAGQQQADAGADAGAGAGAGAVAGTAGAGFGCDAVIRVLPGMGG